MYYTKERIRGCLVVIARHEVPSTMRFFATLRMTGSEGLRMTGSEGLRMTGSEELRMTV